MSTHLIFCLVKWEEGVWGGRADGIRNIKKDHHSREQKRKTPPILGRSN